MKMIQQDVVFNPIELVLETAEEAHDLWSIINNCRAVHLTPRQEQLAIKIANWFSNEAHL